MIAMHLLSYRILNIYISYKCDNSTIINRLTVTCPRYITNLDIINYITESVIKHRSISKAIGLLSDNCIYPIENNSKYYSYDILLYLHNDITCMTRYCEYLNCDKYLVINDIIEK